MKVHYGILIDGWEITDFIIRCGIKTGESTSFIENVTCKNCLKVLEMDLLEAKLKAYPNMIHNKKTGTTYTIRERKKQEG